MKPRIYIDGKEGTTGLQIYERLGGREDIELLLIDEDKRKDPQERAKLMNAADVVYVQPELPGESDPAFPRFTQGLGLTEFMLLPHVQEVRHDILDGKRLFEDLTFPDSMGHVFCALEDGSYLLIENGSTTLCGAAWVISNGTMEKINEENEITLL